jgi:hypothetical protein
MPAENEVAGAQRSVAYDSRARRWRCGAVTVAAAIVIFGLFGLLWKMGH